jgi:hypothetical protein
MLPMMASTANMKKQKVIVNLNCLQICETLKNKWLHSASFFVAPCMISYKKRCTRVGKKGACSPKNLKKGQFFFWQIMPHDLSCTSILKHKKWKG